MSQLPTRVIIRDGEGVEVDRGRWLASSAAAGITIVSDADRGWFRDYRYPEYTADFEAGEFPKAPVQDSKS